MSTDLNYQLACLTVYRRILNDPVIAALRRYLDSETQSGTELLLAADAFHEMVYRLVSSGRSWGEHLLTLVIHDDNPFSRQSEMAGLSSCSPALLQAVMRDMRILQRLYNAALVNNVPQWQELEPLFTNTSRADDPSIFTYLDTCPDWAQVLPALAEWYRCNSRGIVSRCRAFRYSEQGLTGIEHPDRPHMSDLIGYESQKAQIIANTRQFVEGYPANNVLLYGSRGTGKSTMVKALLSEFADSSLRLVEIQRDQLGQLPLLVNTLNLYHPPFIIFIDDLSFEDYETGYKGLKAVMEGSLDRQPHHVLIYATSNRRHLVREYFGDRSGPGEEIHTQDTLQEKLSLADRFGLTLTFPPPGQRLYLEIIEHLVKERGIQIDNELLRRQALEWERAHHGVSGRTARQFVDSLGAGQ